MERTFSQPQWKTPPTKAVDVLYRKCACGAAPGPAGQCAACRRKQPGIHGKRMLQKKVTVNQPGDRYEREADHMARQVMYSPASRHQHQQHDRGEGLRRPIPVVQRRTGRNTSRLTGTPPTVQQVLRSPGQPLQPATREMMESGFGHDFSQVRVHTDARAALSAQAVEAQAYTVGQDVVFDAGQYAPATQTGRGLLAHELTHVVQQTGLRANPSSTILQRKKRGPAGGCGVCLGDPRVAGRIAHEEIQAWFKALDPDFNTEMPVQVVPGDETPPFTPRLDLALTESEMGISTIFIGEIKPLDDEGQQKSAGREQLKDYARELQFTYDEVFRMELPAPPVPLPFINPVKPPACPSQLLHVQKTEPGLYQYYCEPPFLDLVKNPNCRCIKPPPPPPVPVGQEQEQEERRRVRDEDKIRIPGPEVLVPVAALIAIGAFLKQATKRLAGRALGGPALGIASAAAAIILLTSGKARAGFNPEGEEPLLALFRAFEEDGVPIPEEIQKMIKDDQELRELINNGLKSGKVDEAQQQINERMSKMLAENAEQLTREELKTLLGVAELAGSAVPGLEADFARVHGEIQKASEARQARQKAGETGTDRATERTDTAGNGGAGPGPTREQPGRTTKRAPAASAEARRRLLRQIRQDSDLRSTLEAFLGSGGVEPDEEFLRRLVALKPLIKRHRAALDQYLANRQEGTVSDPISQIIVPIEQYLHQEEQHLRQKLSEVASGDEAAGEPVEREEASGAGKDDSEGGVKDGDGEKTRKKPAAEGADKAGGEEGRRGTAQPGVVVIRRSFPDLIQAGQITFPNIIFKPNQKNPATDTPKQSIKIIARLSIVSGESALVYRIPLKLSLVRREEAPESHVWLATYNFTVPGGIIRSEQGDVPIRFEDRGSYQIRWGRIKKAEE